MEDAKEVDEFNVDSNWPFSVPLSIGAVKKNTIRIGARFEISAAY